MSEQSAGVANVLNLRCRLRSDIAELELPNFGGQVCVAIGDQLACRLARRSAALIAFGIKAANFAKFEACCTFAWSVMRPELDDCFW